MKIHALVVLILLLAPVQAGTRPAPIVVFDMPHGGCRLSVNSDGSGSLAYGALPARVRIKPGTFMPSVLVAELERAVVPRSGGAQSLPSGSVKFGSSEELFWFNDGELSRVHFHKALANAEAAGEMEEAAARRIHQTCREA
jgi:hypothetical protein